MNQSPCFTKDDRLHAENARLRRQLEDMQKVNYVGKLNDAHTRETEKLCRKITGLEKEAAKEHDLRMVFVRENERLRLELGIATAEKVTIVADMKSLEEQLAEKEGIIQKLTAQVNRDYTNSSIPASQCMNRATIHNGRTASERKPGGQPGHQGHKRKVLKATSRMEVPAPCTCSYCEGDNIKPTGRSKRKQCIELKLLAEVTDFVTAEYICKACGKRFYSKVAGLPDNEVFYGPGLKTIVSMLGNYCNVSIDKVSQLISNATEGKINISKGTVSNLLSEFSVKSAASVEGIIKDIRMSPIMHSDATSARLDGKSAYVLVYGNNNGIYYSGELHKGHAALQESPADHYEGILVHDHDTTYYSYGSMHQECNVHVLRYLLDAAENERALTWHLKMREHLLDMNNAKKEAIRRGKTAFEKSTINALEKKYIKLLDLADKEYREHPPTKYYKDGKNLAARLRKYSSNHLLFLHNFIVPFENNFSERSLRKVKGKTKSAGTFRSLDYGLQSYCDFISIAETAKSKGKSVYQTVFNVFDGKDNIWE